MSKMKHLLRILHIGGNCEVNQGRHAPASSASSSSSTIPDSADHGRSPERPPRAGDLGNSPSLLTPGMVRLGSAAVNERDDALNFNLLEEEYQMQLALAISASDPNTNEDPESIQMKAVKRISLGCSPSPGTTLVEFLSLRYWKYNVVNYDEKVSDGFYDVFGVIHDPTSQGKFPSLMELQSRSFVDVMSYEIVLVNRLTDTTLQRLEQTASCIAVECHAFELGPVHSGLIQKIADLVVDNMGGPVNDADEMSKQWTERSYQLKASLNSIVLPLGCLNIGLSRHRALLFKVLADKINLPCRLVKGSYYTDTDDGAVNMIKIDHDSEFIIDLMGAPGTLIPAEISSSHPQIAPSDTMCSDTISQTIQELCLALDNNDPRSGTKSGGLHLSSKSSVCPPTIHSGSSEGVICCDEPVGIDIALSQSDRAEKFESKCPPPFDNSCKILARTTGTPAQQQKVNDVSMYVISAAQDPQFAQKLHAVLLESGAFPPPDLFSDMNLTQVEGKDFNPEPSISVGEDSCFEDCASSNHNMCVFPTACLKPETDDQRSVNKQHSDTAYQIIPYVANSRMVIPFSNLSERRLDLSAANDAGKDQTDEIDSHTYPQFNEENINDHAIDRKMVRNDQHAGTISYNGKISPEFAEWEILWEDLQIGERIGLGSYGEVYHAEWNGTEVAVKKFLDQDLSGDAIQQFKCEVEIMLRLRHPNVVLFMGAVTRPPNLSILTEFLPRGSLFRLLHRSSIQINEKRRLKMALDVAKGMNYLHTSHPTIVHRDLKSPNLLVDKNWVVKVCDFGLSRLKHHTFLSSKSTAGTPEWMAPEVLRNEPSNEKCDVYSFGVILWELVTLHIPWSGMNPMQVVGAVGFQNRHLDIPEEVHPMVAKIIRDCWESDPSLRPSFSQLLPPLKNLPRLVVES